MIYVNSFQRISVLNFFWRKGLFFYIGQIIKNTRTHTNKSLKKPTASIYGTTKRNDEKIFTN